MVTPVPHRVRESDRENMAGWKGEQGRHGLLLAGALYRGGVPLVNGKQGAWLLTSTHAPRSVHTYLRGQGHSRQWPGKPLPCYQEP